MTFTMRNIFYIIFLYIFVLEAISGQLIDNRKSYTIPNNINNNLPLSELSMFDRDRFSMLQSFSLSSLSLNNQMTSILGYKNRLSYHALDNLRFDADIMIYQPISNGMNSDYNKFNILYDAGFTYSPLDNIIFQFKMKNKPMIYNHPYGF